MTITKTKAKAKTSSIDAMLLDKQLDIDHRRHMLLNLVMDESDGAKQMISSILDRAASASGEQLYEKKLQEVSELKQAMEAGPLRPATFLRLMEAPLNRGTDAGGNGKAAKRVVRAEVLLEDGATAYTVVPEHQIAEGLRLGDTVLLEAQGKALLFVDAVRGPVAGEEARLERRIDAHLVEVMLRDHEKSVYYAAAPLSEKLDSGEVEPGAWLVVCPRRQVAFEAVPAADGLAHFRFLANEPVPDVLLQRDVGSPPPFIDELSEHIHMEMTEPDLPRSYRLMRSRFVLLCGVSGSGKTLSLQAAWRRMYEVMHEVTGVPIDELPPRVLRLRSSQVLSKWYGESEKLLDRFFDEVEQLADETFVAPDGKEYRLPVLVICEEAEAIGRSRGSDPVHDRVQNTLLERLDITRQRMKDQLILFAFTTNLPEAVDPAFLRRVSGQTVRFSRLTSRACSEVLDKHLRGIPVVQNGEADQLAAKRRIRSEVLPWLFSPRGEDKGQVELTYAGATQPVTKYRRDFLTAALVARSVQEAAHQACQAQRRGETPVGLTGSLLIAALDRQVRAVVDQLHESNVHHYIDLPDGVRVASIRRIPQPAVHPVEVERHES